MNQGVQEMQSMLFYEEQVEEISLPLQTYFEESSDRGRQMSALGLFEDSEGF
jgi:hypothetical protein